MKKHLIAAAVVSAFAVPAMAQNVSLYGVIDTGINRVDASNAATDTYQLKSSTIATGRLGLRGTEDLGGGLKASFRLESTLDVAKGRLGDQGADDNSTTDKSSNNNFFNRGAEVGLSGAFGAVKVGQFDVTGTENIDSAMSKIGNIGNLISGTDIGSDQQNAVQYTLPVLQGWTVQVGHAFNDGNTGASTYDPGETSSIFVSGAIAGVNVQAGYSVLKVSGAINADATTANPLLDANATLKQTAIGLSYNAGFADLGLVYSSVESDVANNDADDLIFTFKAPLGSGYALHGMIGGSERTGTDTDRYALAVSKELSKRTSLYAGYVDTDVQNGAQTKEMVVSVIHTF